MGRVWYFLTHVHSLSGPALILLYPLYASVIAIETPTKVDDEQWLAYWIIYSFLTLVEMLIQPLLEWITIWYTLKLAFVAWLVLPQFRGAAFIYNKFVRETMKHYRILDRLHKVHDAEAAHVEKSKSKSKSKDKKKFTDYVSFKKAT